MTTHRARLAQGSFRVSAPQRTAPPEDDIEFRIELLRERGADPQRENLSGQTPVGIARLIANYDVARFFTDLA